jgi:excinuclease ABC subunit C
LNKDLKQLTNKFPDEPGIYKFFNDNEVLYIGKAKNLKKRVKSYFSANQTYKTKRLVSIANNINFVTTNNEVDALLLEQNLIKSEKPKFNILLRDDKSYPFIHLDEKHPYPKIETKRVLKGHEGLYGPYTSAYATRIAVNQIQKVFKIRTCSDSYFKNRSRPCMEYQIGRCTAPCVGEINEADYKKDIEDTKTILKGNFKELEKKMRNEMLDVSEQEKFEQAAAIRDRLEQLEKINQKQIIFSKGSNTRVVGIRADKKLISVAVIQVESDRFVNLQKFVFKNHLQKNDYDALLEFIPSLVQKYPSVNKIVTEFDVKEQDIFGNIKFIKPVKGKKSEWVDLANKNAVDGLFNQAAQYQKYAQSLDFLKRNLKIADEPIIVGFDVSGVSGDVKTVSCVNYVADSFDKSKYRFFRVPMAISESDLDSLVFGVNKYLKSIPKIDLLLIDGGKTHLKYVKDRIDLDIPCVSVSKGVKRKYGLETLHTDIGDYDFRNSEDISKLFLDVRDEAHRFALKNFRSKQRKDLKQHFLFDINGVGPKIVQRIYDKYKSVEPLTKLSSDKISSDLKIKNELAQEIQSLTKEIYN